ncbi:MAG TPA: FAD-binding protein, partial [Candidatus Altiarchaeales archaeon]|nr:FAD-binding protein [Candidatus Altiarchaeales archaeon]
MKDRYDVIIVGAGPAGMFAAYELVDKSLDILIVDKGKDINKRKCPMVKKGKCINCEPCNIMCGVGGSGTFSDGTLNLRPDIGGDLVEIIRDSEKARDLVDRVDRIFMEFGAPKKLYGVNKKRITDLKRKASAAGIRFVEIPQRHIGTDNAPKVIEKFEKNLRERGVEFLLQSEVRDILIKNSKCKGVLLKNGKKIKAKCVLVAPGRIGASWLSKISEKHRIKTKFEPIDVGVRIEVPAIIMDPIIAINRDPKFHIRTKRYDDFVRTFCTNHRGFVVKENYDGIVGVNGHSTTDNESENTNFAFLVRVSLTKPVENT